MELKIKYKPINNPETKNKLEIVSKNNRHVYSFMSSSLLLLLM